MEEPPKDKPAKVRKPINVKRARAKRNGLSMVGTRGGVETVKRAAKSGLNGRGRIRGAKGIRIDDQYFPSQAEGQRYVQLKELLAQDVISELELQPKFPIIINNIKVCEYRADFRYKVIDDLGKVIRVVVEDVKGMMTDMYKLKRKMVQASYGFNIIEIPSKKVASFEGIPS